MLDYELILSPSMECRNILLRRMGVKKNDTSLDDITWGGVLLVQGKVAQLIAATDVATKAASVIAREIWGNCPQHITTIAFIGEVAEVGQALNALKQEGMVK